MNCKIEQTIISLFLDGRLNGYCEVGVVDCVDANTTCDTSNDVCKCITGFTEIAGVCKKGRLI